MSDDLVKRVEDEARAHYSGIPSMRRNVADLLAEVQVELVAQAARIERVEAALRNIRELNMMQPDENGQRWANSDLIEQEIIAVMQEGQA